MKTQRFKLGNLCCVVCADEVQKALRAATGVASVTMDYIADKVSVRYDETRVKPGELVQLIESVGCGCSKVTPEEQVSSMAAMKGEHAHHRAGSAPVTARPAIAHINHQVQMAPISMGTKMDRMQYEMPATPAEHLHHQIQAQDIEHAAHEGMEGMAHVGMDHDMSDPKMARAMEIDMRNRFFVALVLTIPTVLYSPLFTRFFNVKLPAPVDPNWIMFVLSTPVVWWSGWIFIAGAYTSLRYRALNMSVLIAVGVLAAYLFSVLTLVTGGDAFFEAAAMLVTFVLFGHWMEMRARRGTNDALRALFDLVPPQARVLRDGQEVSIPTSEVVAGDVLVLRPGDKVPVDGQVVEGETPIDESLVTGESMPVHKGPGDEIVGGSINGSGSITFRATKVGGDTVLAQIAALVTQAQNSKAGSQRLADVAAQYLVVLAVGSGLVTFLAWYFLGAASVLVALTFAISAVVIACPDALGLATPTAVAVGTGLGAKHNILIKDASTLERVSKVNAIVLDKTGTLTAGKPRVTDVGASRNMSQSDGMSSPPDRTSHAHGSERVPGWREDEVLRLQAGAEARSNHPISLAILDEAKRRNLSVPDDVRDFESLSGRGVQAVVEGKKLLVGTVRLMEENGVDVAPLKERVEKLLAEAKTLSILAVDGKLAGVVAVADPVKPSAQETIRRLKEAGIEAVMITGDNKATARAVAASLGIERFFAEVLPADKAGYVRQLQSEGKFVAMVGDGINDAPALAQADIGIAIGSGTDVAIQTAEIVLMKSDPLDIMAAIKLSKATVTKMKQNLFWASIYNVLAIPVAAGVLYPGLGISIGPEFSALLMSASSLIVAVNAVLLKRADIVAS